MIKTTRIVRTLCAVSLFLACMAVTGVICISQNLKGYFSGIDLFFTHCYALKLSYLTILPMIWFIFPFLVAAIMLSGLFRAVYISFLRFRKYSMVKKKIPVVQLDASPKLKTVINKLKLTDTIILFESHLAYAFSSGILHPAVYVSNGLIAQLSEEELTLVILHEKYHIKSRDCLKIACMGFIVEWLYFLSIFRWLSNVYSEYIEKKIDEQVVHYCGDPLFLASTLLKIVKLNNTALSLGIGLSIVDRYSLENRVRYLVDKEEHISLPIYRLFKNVLIAAVLFIPVFFYVFSTQGSTFAMYKSTIDNVCAHHEGNNRDNHHGNDLGNHSGSGFFKE